MTTFWKRRFYDRGDEFTTAQAGEASLTDGATAMEVAQATAAALARLVEELEDEGRLDPSQVQRVLDLYHYVSTVDAE